MGISADQLLTAGGGAQRFIDSVQANIKDEKVNWLINDQSASFGESYIDYLVNTVERLDGIVDLDFELENNISLSDINVTLVDFEGQSYAGRASVQFDDKSNSWIELEIVDYSSEGNTRYNQNTFIHELGHALGLGEPGYDSRWDQDDTAMSYNQGDIGWQNWYTESDLNAFYSVWGIEDNFSAADNIINSVIGRGKLRGTKLADQFSFTQFEQFGRLFADKIINFNASQSDKIALSSGALPSLADNYNLKFVSTNDRVEMRKFARQNYDIVYFEGGRNGRLFFNGNGEKKGWGNSEEGGLFAILKGRPELSVDNFTLLT